MLTTGFNHVAVLTNDTERLKEFYTSVFDAEILAEPPGPPGERAGDVRMTIVQVGPTAEHEVVRLEDADAPVGLVGDPRGVRGVDDEPSRRDGCQPGCDTFEACLSDHRFLLVDLSAAVDVTAGPDARQRRGRAGACPTDVNGWDRLRGRRHGRESSAAGFGVGRRARRRTPGRE